MGKPKQIDKKHLIMAAKKQLLSEGLGSVTLKSVAENVGVTQGVVYYHFKTKHKLLLSLLEQYLDDLDNHSKTMETSKEILAEEMYKAQISSEEQRLFIELTAMSLHEKELKQKLGQALRKRIHSYSRVMDGDIQSSRLLAALIDGLALQAALDPTFPQQDMYVLANEIVNGLLKKTAHEASE
jgi:AcrR family transcriptional regulator